MFTNLLCLIYLILELIFLVIITNIRGLIPPLMKWPLFLIQVMISFHALFSNPGIPDRNIIQKNNPTLTKTYKSCCECGISHLEDSLTEHCFDCDLCIEGFDHHCDILNKCVGKNNYWTFYGSLVMVILMSIILFIDTIPMISKILENINYFGN